MEQALQDWCEANTLPLTEIVENRVFELENNGEFKSFLLIQPDKGRILQKEMGLLLGKENIAILREHKIDAILFSFGGRYYYTDVGVFDPKKRIEVKFNEFKHIIDGVEEEFCHLGVHGEYELLNGSHSAEDWVKRAKFLGHKSLGIADHNTLAGTLSFQMACEKGGIKPIIGETVTIKYTEDLSFEGKVYAKDTKGWRNLLRINKAINIDNAGLFIDEKELLKYGQGVVFVFATNSYISRMEKVAEIARKVSKYASSFDSVYYQIDSVEFTNATVDDAHLHRLKTYFRDFSHLIAPIVINDSYYLDKEEHRVKEYLNEIGGRVLPHSTDQYYKNMEQTMDKFSGMFVEDEHIELLMEGFENTLKVAEDCNFLIPTGQHKLPKYEPVTIHEVGHNKTKYKKRRMLFEREYGIKLDQEDTNEDLFYKLLEEGWSEKLGHLTEKERTEYEERLHTEVGVIVPAGFIDYFLILWDMIRWAKYDANILVGNARGSVAGSLVAYLLDITTVDPIKYNLLFERFLNKTRVSGERAKAADALPDIDVDFEGLRRDDVKEFMRVKYGRDYVATIGTYNRMKLKSAMKDFGKVAKMDFQYMNRVTKNIDDQLKYTWEDLFKYAQENGQLKKWVQENRELINDMKFVLNQARSAGQHASALIIVPKEDEDGNPMTIYDWLPVKLMDGNIVTEWEGKYIDRAGYLKEDILGLYQLDKFHMMLDLIKKFTGEDLVLEDIEFDEEKVFEYFANAWNEDVFQFGSSTFKRYLSYMKPENLEDLIAANALIRPGPMSSEAHLDFARMKQGEKQPEYDYGLKEVTKNTQGLYIYQEQIMQAVHVLGGLSLSQADEVRTIMKKFDKNKMATFEKQFKQGAVERGCSTIEAEKIWVKLEKFSGYGFNRSHSAAYSIMGYWSMWLKVHHPLAFWATSLHFSDDNEIPFRLVELVRNKDITVTLPDINESESYFAGDINTNTIYWSLNKVRGIAMVSSKKITNERKVNGKFKNLKDFVNRMKGTGVGKGQVHSLIMAGAFDNMYGVENLKDRFDIVKRHRALIMEEVPEDIIEGAKDNDFWLLQQRAVIGFGQLDYEKLTRKKNKKMSTKLLTAQEFEGLKITKKWGREGVIAGQIVYFNEYTSRKGVWGMARLLTNDGVLNIKMGNEVWSGARELIVESKTKGAHLAILGNVTYDDWSKTNVLACWTKAEVVKIL